MSNIHKISEYLNIQESKFDDLGIFNPFIGIDTNLFLDPALLRNTDIPEFKNSYSLITKHFNNVLILLNHSKNIGDNCWKEAYKRLLFKETRGISIGYGASSSDGNAIGPRLARKITETANEIAKLDVKDPSIFELICLFEEGLGADRLSDMVISIIKRDILIYTNNIIETLNIESKYITNIKHTPTNEVFRVINNPSNIKKPFLLLPKKLLRDLPLAVSRDDIGYIVYFNEDLRKKVSSLILRDAPRSIKDIKKEEYKKIFLNKKNIEEILFSYKKTNPKEYDFDGDPNGEIKWLKNGKEFASNFPLTLDIKTPKTVSDVKDIVFKIINQFKRNIESNELYELLYKEPISKLKPRNERYAQRLFYSIADTYCEANNIVLSREPNAGNGPVDFKVSKDYKTQVLVEIKLSTGKVRNGFEKQLPEYEKNENAQNSFLVIIKVTETSKAIDDVIKIRESAIEEKKHVPEIVSIDAFPRASASKPKNKKRYPRR